MTVHKKLMTAVACGLTLTFVFATVEPVLAKDPEPYNAADAARKYCGRAYKRYCSKVPDQGIEALNCLKQNMNRLPTACRKAVQQL